MTSTAAELIALRANLCAQYDAIDREKIEALQAPNANPEQINLISIRKYSARYVAFRAALAQLEARS